MDFSEMCQVAKFAHKGDLMYHVGHPAYPTGINQLQSVKTLHGVYALLWERGAPPAICAAAVRDLQKGSEMGFATTRAGVIEIHAIPPHFKVRLEG